MKILVVEDNENSRVLQENALEATGYDVISAENGRIALEIIRKSPPALVITDLLMPEMDGYALCRELKRDPVTRSIPIIVYTATFTDPEDEKLALALGAARFIVKPMEIQDFLKEIEQVLQNGVEVNAAPITELKNNVIDLEKDHSSILTKKLGKKSQDLKEEHDKLMASEQRYRQLVEELGKAKQSLQKAQELAHLGNWEWDIAKDSLWWSDEIYRIFGLSPEHAQPTYETFLETVHPEDKALVQNAVEHALAGKGAYRIDHRIVLPDKSEKVVTEQGEVLFDSKGKAFHMTGTVQDITERTQMEVEKVDLETKLRQAQKMEAIGTLAGGIAHDFNNILTPIIGYAEILTRNLPRNSPDRGHAIKITDAASRAKDLVNQILTFSRETEQEQKPLQVRFVLNEALKLIRSTIPSTIDIRQDLNKNCGAVMADPTQVHQIVMNLCTNAYQAMRETGGTLGVKLSSVSLGPYDYVTHLGLKPGHYNRIEISDTGCGMAKSILERIFDPYFTTKEKGEGTGLGLAVVHGIVKNHGGHITVYSEPGLGTNIHVYLPEIETEPVSDETVTKTESAPGGNEAIMLVDDEMEILHMENTFLTKLGYSVQTFSNGLAALDAFQQNPDTVDLLVTDMTMPKMTGAELAEKVLSIRSDLPIVLCSGFSEVINKEKALALGIRRFVMKPLILSEFAWTVRRVLDEKNSGP